MILIGFTSLYGKENIDLSLLNLCEEFSWGLERVSSERITYEVSRILGAKKPVDIFNQMESCKILDVIFDKSVQINGLEKLIKVENKYFGLTGDNPYWHLRLASILSYKKIIDLKNIVLSNSDKKILRNIFDAASMLSVVINSNNPNSSFSNFLYKFGDSSFALSGFLLANSQNENPSDQIWLDFFKKINSYKYSKFPINAKVLLDMGFEEGKYLGDELRYLKKLWIGSGFTMTLRELKNLLVKRKK